MDDMRSVQKIFDIVIENDYYSEHTCPWMCNALIHASLKGVITDEEANSVIKEIQRYMKDYVFLREALNLNGLASCFADRLAIYKNWNYRPTIRLREEILSEITEES